LSVDASFVAGLERNSAAERHRNQKSSLTDQPG
jgi:hypothetical protein